VLGHSWGALVAIAIGLRNDYPIRGLVLASGYYFPTWRWDVWMMSGPAIPVLGDLVRYTVAPIISWATLPTLFRKLFAPLCSTKLQERVPGFANAQAQTVEGGCRGKCLPRSDGSTVPVSLSKHSVSCSHFPRNRGPSYRARTGATSTPGAEPLGPASP
jgi:pimeloyl-ACP methyl ester carboxylesterase